MNEKRTAPAAFTIAKTEPDKMLVFGWGNVAVDADGTQIEDLQGDIIDPEELEKAAYDHVLNFRNTGERHDPGMRKKGRLVESCVFTKEKQAAIGIPPGVVPEGWWVGYKIDDQDAWEKIKKGEYQSFSIDGKGERTPVEKARERTFKAYGELRKANPYHDARGRFTSKGGNGRSYSVKDLDDKLFNRNAFTEIAENETVQSILDDEEYDAYGIRVQEKDTDRIGETMEHRSRNFGGEFEDDPDMAQYAGEELNGVSTIGIDNTKYVTQYGGYEGRVAYLLGTNRGAESGYDPGEEILEDPVVLAKLGYKNGQLVVLDSVKGVAKSYSDLRKFNPYHDSRGRFSTANGYATFTARTKDPKKQHWADAAIAREKKRQAAATAAPAKPVQPKAPQKPATPPKPKVTRDALGFADHDDADYHDLYNGSGYYKQQKLDAATKQALNSYLDPDEEFGSLYNFSQNMNHAVLTGTINQQPKYKKVFNQINSKMHNLGYNVNLTRYDHGEFLDDRLAGAGIRGGHAGMSVAQLKKALVGQQYGDPRILSTSYNNFKDASASSRQIFATREVKITYQAKAGAKALMPGDGPGGKLGEMLLSPSNKYKIVDVKLSGNKARAKGQPHSNMKLNQIEVVVEVE